MITREEYELLIGYRAIGYKWIARDKNKMLYVYSHKPFKVNCMRYTSGEETSYNYISYSCHNDAFKSITWEDEEPTKINDLIRDYESHQIITGENILNNFFGTDNFNIKYVPQFKNLLSSLKKDAEYLENKSSCEHRSKQEEANMNKSKLIKEIEDVFDNIGIHDYHIGESCENYDNWGIDSKRVRDIFSVIDKHIPDNNNGIIPQFVADWIEEIKDKNCVHALEILFDTASMPTEVYDWLKQDSKNWDIMARAWLDGYVVVQEKLYTVMLANGKCLYRYVSVGIDWIKGPSDYRNDKDFQLTQSEIESVDPVLMQIAKEVE